MRFRTVFQLSTMALIIPALPELARAQESYNSPRPAGTRAKPATGLPSDNPSPPGHMEVPEDEPVRQRGRVTSPAGRWVRKGYVSVQVNVDEFGDNIVNDAANEPSIAVDPTNPTKMAIGWRQFDTIASNFRQAGWGYTADGGQSWTFPGVVDPGVFRSDPVLCTDTEGTFFYNSLTASGNDFWCNVYKSADGGASWDSGIYAYGGDKQWMAADLTDGIGQDNLYAYWTRWYTCPGCDGHFTRSYDGGQTFLPTIDVPGSPQWGTLAVGPDGELYIAGMGFTVTKSSTMQDESLPAAFDFSVTVDLDGSIGFSGGPNPGGLLGQVWIAVDHSDGATRGNVYLLCSVQRSSTADPLDVMFARSTDGGLTWSDPVRVNDDPEDNGAYQWFGTMSVAPNGRIDATWNDTRNDTGGYDSELYYAYSTDAGQTWSANDVLSPPFDPHVGWPQQNKLGDYNDMVSDSRGVSLAYAATFNGEQDVYYLRIGEPFCKEAGTVALDLAKYACESTVTITVADCDLNTDDEVVDSVIVDIDSDSETGVEQVTLIETAAATAWFEGSIGLSEVNSSGVLWVAEGDTVTATYLDADDGAGGSNVTVTADAPVDCTPPLISNVQVADLNPRGAVIAFDTDEPATGAVRYGLACGTLDETATQSGFHTGHTVALSELDKDTTYFYAADAADEAGNPASDDQGGICYTLSTPDSVEYFTELFIVGNDLDDLSLWFTPDGSFEHYAACVEPITELPTNPAEGNELTLSDDGYQAVTLSGGQRVAIYGDWYSTFHISANGYVTFGSGDTEYEESAESHFRLPRISALFDDLSPQNGGTLSWKQLTDRVAVTWENAPEFSTIGSNTLQIEMYFDGTIVLSYLDISATDGLAGLSAGGGVPAEFYATDLSAMGACEGDCNGNGIPDDLDIAGGTSGDANDNGVPDECEVQPAWPASYPHNRSKNRYITFDSNPGNAASPIAFKVELKQLELGSCSDSGAPCRLDHGDDDCRSCSTTGSPCITAPVDCPPGETCELTGEACINDQGGSVGTIWWVGPESPLGNGVHLMVSEPYRREDLGAGWGAVVQVADCEVVPRAVYGVRAVHVGTGAESAELEVATAPKPDYYWADAVGELDESCTGNWAACTGDGDCPSGETCIEQWSPPDGVANFTDITAAVFAFQQKPGLTLPEVAWVDLHGNDGGAATYDPPNYVVNFADIGFIVRAFQGRPYPFSDPGDCPDVGAWP